MRITKNQLARIITEELHRVLSEHPDPWADFDRLHDEQKDEPEIYGTSTLSPKLTARAAEDAEGQGIWDGDYDVSPCCGVDQDSDIDICTNCGEHTGGGIPASEYYA